MATRRLKLSNILAVLLLLSGVVAVDHSVFKTCSQSGFCRRNRQFESQESAFVLDNNSIKIRNNVVTMNLQDTANNHWYTLSLSSVHENIFRFEIDEKYPLRERYRVTDALVNDLKARNVLIESSKSDITIRDGSNRAAIQVNPFRIDFYDQDKLVVSANAKGMLKFEHSRHKPSNPVEGEWEEEFNGFVDSKPRGPESVGIDFTFHNAEVMFGIPEHADDFVLKETIREESDPSVLSQLSWYTDGKCSAAWFICAQQPLLFNSRALFPVVRFSFICSWCVVCYQKEHPIEEMNEIINTAQFRFPPGSARPSWEEIANFIKQLDTDPMLMEAAYRTAQDRSLFVKFTSFDAMMESLKRNLEPRKFSYTNGDSVMVRMCIAGINMQYVRVFDLPPELDDEKLAEVLGSYGDVERVVREKFSADLGLAHMFTGVRGVYINVKKPIPPSLDVLNRKGRIFYTGLKDTCFLCLATGHRRESCPKRAVRNKQQSRQQETPSNSSYADVVSGKETIQLHVDTVESEIIEILEEEVEEQNAESAEEEHWETIVCETANDSEKEIRRKESIKQLEEVAKSILEVMGKPPASERRAQFAASRSTSGSGSAPRKKCARRTFY